MDGGQPGVSSVLVDIEPALRALALKLCRDRAEADDLVQDTVERALRNAERLRQRDAARSWLCAIMHNLFIDRCRRRARRPTAEPTVIAHLPAPAPPAAEPLWARLSRADVRAALEVLPAPFREVFVMHCFEARSYDDIAARLGIAKATVGSRLHRARRLLKDELERRARAGADEAAADCRVEEARR